MSQKWEAKAVGDQKTILQLKNAIDLINENLKFIRREKNQDF